jgi:hypothetical protein
MGVGVGIWLFWAGRGLALLVMRIVRLGGDVAGRVVTVRIVRVAIQNLGSKGNRLNLVGSESGGISGDRGQRCIVAVVASSGGLLAEVRTICL